MKNFTKPQLIKSLAFPIATLLYSVLEFLSEICSFWVDSFTVFDIVRAAFFLLAVLAGGVLPVLLTFFRNIHTERYFFKRLITFGVCLAAIWFANHTFIHRGILGSIYIIAVVGGKVVYELLKVQDKETTGGERAVMFLSDCIIIYGLHSFLVTLRDLSTLKFVEIL